MQLSLYVHVQKLPTDLTEDQDNLVKQIKDLCKDRYKLRVFYTDIDTVKEEKVKKVSKTLDKL